ncbi:BRO-N domain-containing protein [Sphingobium yanoikuyae]|jgi:prophage antirepressor-like protein|uniref:BRO-N domain-containing protein n=1 Tax=Sphingobium yanoikuyae TaxID=13690 RepID=UPI000262C884|nr:BRO family protein [Sphingobium yanoikuyae]
MNDVIDLSFEGASIRSVIIDGEPGFAGRDVCLRLGYADPTNAMKQHCKGVAKHHPLPTAGGPQKTRILFMPDVLRLIAGSTLPDAERMERWMFEEVLPTVIRTGTYVPDGIVNQFAPAARSTLGGIVKRVTHAELQEALPALVEPMIERLLDARMLTDRRKLVEGISALEIAEMAGYTKGKRPRGLIQFITRRIRRYHEDRGILPHRTPHGSCKVLIYVEAIVRRWLIEGGRVAIEAYVSERHGQGKLRLVHAKEVFNGQ